MKSLVIVADSSFVIETIRLALRNPQVSGSSGSSTVVAASTARSPSNSRMSSSTRNARLPMTPWSESEMSGRARGHLHRPADMRMDDESVAQAIDAGVDACLSKSTPLPTIGTLVREVADRNIISATPPRLRDVKR